MSSISEKMTDDNYRYKFQMILVPLLFGTVSLGMFILNVIMHKTSLMYATGSFSVFMYLTVAVTFIFEKQLFVPKILFEVSILCLFQYFIISGGTESFSSIWILLLPAFGCYFLGLKHGVTVIIIQFVLLIFFYWIPIGKGLLICEYTGAFLLRFPLIYIVSAMIGILMEVMRRRIYQELKNSEELYKIMSSKDVLTGLSNRFWFDKFISKHLKEYIGKYLSIMILDIDDFKKFNDTYGHLTGDAVLQKIAETIKSCSEDAKMSVRWGGEEFLVILPERDETEVKQTAETLRKKIEDDYVGYQNKNLKVTVSIGVTTCVINENSQMKDIVAKADLALYEAKQSGKNRVAFSD